MLKEPTYLCVRIALLSLHAHYTSRRNIYSWEKEEAEAEAPAIRCSADNRCLQATKDRYDAAGAASQGLWYPCHRVLSQMSNHAEENIRWNQNQTDPVQRWKDGATSSQCHCATYTPVVLLHLVELLFSSPNICLSSLPLLMDLHWYSDDMGALRVKLDTQLLNILLKSFPGITGWAAYNTDLMAKAATAFCFMLLWYLSGKRVSRHS